MMVAALHGRAGCAATLLEGAGGRAPTADPDVATVGKMETALHLAAFSGHLAVVELLLQHGASTAAVNEYNETAEDSARAARQPQSARCAALIAQHRVAVQDGRPAAGGESAREPEVSPLVSVAAEDRAALARQNIVLGHSADPKVQQLLDVGASEAEAAAALAEAGGDVAAAAEIFFGSLESRLAKMGWLEEDSAEDGSAGGPPGVAEGEREQQYLCEFDCGYKGEFDAVSAHELACDARPTA